MAFQSENNVFKILVNNIIFLHLVFNRAMQSLSRYLGHLLMILHVDF